MGFSLRSLLPERFRPKAQNELKPLTWDQLVQMMRQANAQSDSGIHVSVRVAEGLAAVAACVRIITDQIASLPLQLYRVRGELREPARDTGLYRLLYARPNRWQTSYQFRKLLGRDVLLRGNGYALINGPRNDPTSLMRLHPDTVTPEMVGTRIVYRYRPEGMAGMNLRQEQVLHIWENSDDGVVGLNPIQVHRNSIGDGVAIRQHGSMFFRNAARISGVLEMDAGTKIGEESLKALLSDFDSMYAGNERAHRTAALPAGIKFKEVSISMEDAQWIEARKTTAREIFGIFGVPPHKAGDLERTTFSNIEHSNLDFVIDCLMPRLVAWEQALNRSLLDNDPSLYFKFNVSALLRGDSKSRADFYTKMIASRVMNPNEARALEEMNPYEGGDEFANPNIDTRRNPDDSRERDDDEESDAESRGPARS